MYERKHMKKERFEQSVVEHPFRVVEKKISSEVVVPVEKTTAVLFDNEAIRDQPETPRADIEKDTDTDLPEKGLLEKLWDGTKEMGREMTEYFKIAQHAFGHGTLRERVAIVVGSVIIVAGLLLNIPFINWPLTAFFFANLPWEAALVANFLTYGIVVTPIGIGVTLFGPKCLREHSIGLFQRLVAKLPFGKKEEKGG